MKIAKIIHAGFARSGEQTGIRFVLVTGEAAKLDGMLIAEKLFDYYNNPNSPYNRRLEGEDVKDGEIEEVGREGRCYSLSVGDYVKMEDEDRYIVCESFGWGEIRESLFKLKQRVKERREAATV
jgi:hypothetical protein